MSGATINLYHRLNYKTEALLIGLLWTDTTTYIITGKQMIAYKFYSFNTLVTGCKATYI